MCSAQVHCQGRICCPDIRNIIGRKSLAVSTYRTNLVADPPLPRPYPSWRLHELTIGGRAINMEPFNFSPIWNNSDRSILAPELPVRSAETVQPASQLSFFLCLIFLFYSLPQMSISGTILNRYLAPEASSQNLHPGKLNL